MRSPEQERAKALLAERIATISGSEFIDQHVYGSLPEFANGRSRDGEINIETIQNDGTGAATLEYTLDGSERVFAKLFKDDLGPHSYNLMRGLWDAGFDEQQHYQVPEPLFFMEDLNMILMRAARGTCLADILRADERDTEMAINGVRGSAKWLVRMHAAPIRFGYIDQPWYVFGKLADRLSKASAAHPTEYGRLTKFIDQLRELCARRAETETIQLHGQFRPIHVFLDGKDITVIDLDRSVRGDPGKDLAEFVHRMRTGMIRAADGDAREADAMSRAFLEEYANEQPERLANVPFFQGFHVIVSLCRHMKQVTSDDPELKRIIDFYSAEFADVMAGRLLP